MGKCGSSEAAASNNNLSSPQITNSFTRPQPIPLAPQSRPMSSAKYRLVNSQMDSRRKAEQKENDKQMALMDLLRITFDPRGTQNEELAYMKLIKFDRCMCIEETIDGTQEKCVDVALFRTFDREHKGGHKYNFWFKERNALKQFDTSQITKINWNPDQTRKEVSQFDGSNVIRIENYHFNVSETNCEKKKKEWITAFSKARCEVKMSNEQPPKPNATKLSKFYIHGEIVRNPDEESMSTSSDSSFPEIPGNESNKSASQTANGASSSESSGDTDHELTRADTMIGYDYAIGS